MSRFWRLEFWSYPEFWKFVQPALQGLKNEEIILIYETVSHVVIKKIRNEKLRNLQSSAKY